MARLPFGPDEIRMLSSVLQQTGLKEIELADGDVRIRIVGNTGEAVDVAYPQAHRAADVGQIETSERKASTPDQSNAVKASMAGIVYLKPSPDEPPFIAVGDAVKAGQPLFIIEAMKTFNTVVADKDGVVKAILVTASDFVEYDQPLALLD